MGLPGGCWIPISVKKRICVLLGLARIICPDITRLFHIFPVYQIENL